MPRCSGRWTSAGTRPVRPPTGMAGLRDAVDRRPDLVVLDLGPAGHRRRRGAADAPGGPHGAGHRRHRPRGREHDRPGARRRRRRLRDQAVRRGAARRAHPGGPAALRGGRRPERRDRRRRPGRRRERPHRRARRRSRSTWPPRSSTCCATSPSGPGRWSPSGSCWPRCGDQPYGGADKTVDVHLSWLRRKLGETAQQPRYLHTVRAVGVRLSAPEGTR